MGININTYFTNVTYNFSLTQFWGLNFQSVINYCELEAEDVYHCDFWIKGFIQYSQSREHPIHQMRFNFPTVFVDSFLFLDFIIPAYDTFIYFALSSSYSVFEVVCKCTRPNITISCYPLHIFSLIVDPDDIENHHIRVKCYHRLILKHFK